MKIKCIIIDDEPLAREGLKNYIKEIDFLELAASFPNPLQAMKKMNMESIDLMFLDIQMPKVSGLEFLKSLHKPPMVIIITAYPEYALEGFELDVMDYLVKPVSFEKFLKAVNKVMDYFTLKSKAEKKYSSEDRYFFVKCESKYEKINYDDLLYIEAMQNYVILHTTERKYITYITMKGILESLPAERFLRVQKSYIVNISKVDSIDGNEIKIGEHSVSISRGSKDKVLSRIVSNKLLKRQP